MNSANTQIYILEPEKTVGNNWKVLKCVCCISYKVMVAFWKKLKCHKLWSNFHRRADSAMLVFEHEERLRFIHRMNVCHFWLTKYAIKTKHDFGSTQERLSKKNSLKIRSHQKLQGIENKWKLGQITLIRVSAWSWPKQSLPSTD